MERYVFRKLNAEPIPVEYVADEQGDCRDYEPSFLFWNRRYYLADFIRVQNNPWFGGADFPEYIHGVEQDYIRPLFIEIVDGEEVNIYDEVQNYEV